MKKFMKAMVFGLVLFFPHFAFAATSPESKLMNVLDGITGLLMVLAPAAGILAMVWYGMQYYFAKESHEKSELKKQMQTIGIATVLIAGAATIVKWLFGLAA